MAGGSVQRVWIKEMIKIWNELICISIFRIYYCLKTDARIKKLHSNSFLKLFNMHICTCICVYMSKYINGTCDTYNSNYCKKKEAINFKESKEFVGEFGQSKWKRKMM